MKLYFAGGMKSAYSSALLKNKVKCWLGSFHGMDERVLEDTKDYKLVDQKVSPKSKRSLKRRK